MFDECHKAKKIELDKDGNAVNVGKGRCSMTAEIVVQLQNRLPRARVVYCSATSVSQPANLGFMSRLGLWGAGTEYPSGFNEFLKGIEKLGTGAMEVSFVCTLGNGNTTSRLNHLPFVIVASCYASKVHWRHDSEDAFLRGL